MSKVTYYYNSVTCTYEIAKATFKKRLLQLFAFLSISFVLAIILVWAMTIFFQHPSETQGLYQQSKLQDQYAVLIDKYSDIASKSTQLKSRDISVYRQITQTVFEPVVLLPKFKINHQLVPSDDSLNSLAYHAYQLSERINKHLIMRSRSYERIIKTAKNKEKMLASIPAIHPVSPDQSRFSSKFGPRMHPILKIPKMHEGIDLTADRGTPIYAAGAGIVKRAERSIGGYGNVVEIDHGFGYETKYAHMQKFIVRRNQKVTRGELIGYVGTTGLSVAPHLHYELKVNGTKVNPVPYLSKNLSAQQLNKFLDEVNQEEE